jgi:hypothetical protein
MAQHALGYILDPKRAIFAAQRLVEFEGVVVERGSTGRARRRKG